MRLGVCYFPEHWPSEEWERDVAAMADAGLEYVRMAEFSWGVLEPERGTFDFEWFDEAIELIGDHGMQAVLCTPTATPPKWLVDERPSIRQEDPDGTVREHGSRRHYCFNSDAYRGETARIVERVTERYADSPHVAGWQTDNEFGCHETVRCYCDDCADAFRTWLADRYGDIDRLNEAWGTRSGASSTAPSTKSIRLGRPLQSITPRGCWRTHAFPAIPSSSTIASTPT